MKKNLLFRAATTGVALASLLSGVLGAPLAPKFTYQGKLTDNGVPANGVYDFVFSIYDSANSQLPLAGGGIGIEDVTVENGVFTVALDFGAAVFDGSARWLEVGVRPGTETGDFTLLENRQSLTAAPYALQALSAVNAQTVAAGAVGGQQLAGGAVTGDKISAGQVVKSVNGLKDDVTLVGGGNIAITAEGNGLKISSTGPVAPSWLLGGNTGGPGTFLGTVDDTPLEFRVGGKRAALIQPTPSVPIWIGGSEANTASDSVGGFIGGGGFAGAPNSVQGNYAVVVGGSGNTGKGAASAVVAGTQNSAAGIRSFVGAGSGNSIGTGSTLSGIVGGDSNVIETNTSSAFIGGGTANVVGTGASGSVIVGGGFNSISDGVIRGSIGGGSRNGVLAQYGIVPGGIDGQAYSYGQLAHASGRFAQQGDAQAGEYVLRCQTANTTETEMFLDGVGERIKLPVDSLLAFSIQIIGSSRGPAAAGYEIKGIVQNRDGNLAFIGTPTKTILGETAAGFDARVTTTVNPTSALKVLVTSAPLLVGDYIRWVAVVRTAEVVNHN